MLAQIPKISIVNNIAIKYTKIFYNIYGLGTLYKVPTDILSNLVTI
jgi:hypothetical protein